MKLSPLITFAFVRADDGSGDGSHPVETPEPVAPEPVAYEYGEYEYEPNDLMHNGMMQMDVGLADRAVDEVSEEVEGLQARNQSRPKRPNRPGGNRPLMQRPTTMAQTTTAAPTTAATEEPTTMPVYESYDYYYTDNDSTDVSDEAEDRWSGFDYYGDYYYDSLGNKKKKNKRPGKNTNTQYSQSAFTNNYSYSSSFANVPPAASTWTPVASGTWNTSQGKGQTALTTSSADSEYIITGPISPLLSNGRYCWNCYALSDDTNDAYVNCHANGQMEMCTGEEYFCMHQERRQNGLVTEVGNGCKSAHACLIQMAQNFKFEVGPTLTDASDDAVCRYGQEAEFNEFEAPGSVMPAVTSLCTWCCENMAANRFAPAITDFCNHRDYAGSPMNHHNTNSPINHTDDFAWYADRISGAGALFNDQYINGLDKYHRLFLKDIQIPLSYGQSYSLSDGAA